MRNLTQERHWAITSNLLLVISIVNFNTFFADLNFKFPKSFLAYTL